MSNEVNQNKGRVKSLAEADVKKKCINNKWREVCSVEDCEEQTQRNGLCARHLTESKKQQQSTEATAVAHQSFIYPPMKDSSTIPDDPTNVVSPIECNTAQNTFLGYENIQRTTTQALSAGQNIVVPFVSKLSACSYDSIVSTDQMDTSESSITITSSGKCQTKFCFDNRISIRPLFT
ncbi:unnamed protein product [Rotaria sordida]|uniref:Uncharacterized protein n=1 Tax=Rotaria sordida TaxID=392033 RepID=A0A815EI22_9BILA|nr:unnamed protein product [Rotaria sordida]